jgi:SAM-dependent methyltransferase
MDYRLNPTRDPEFWERLWWQAKESSPVNRRFRLKQEDEIADWNQRAESYAQHAVSGASQNHREKILEWLDSAGALDANFTVLDIGAGPGTFTIPLSFRVREVWALEPAGEMLKILKRRSRQAGAKNITSMHGPWEQIDAVQKGWLGRFDLVFASMSPGISDPEALEKMNRASRKFCYMSGWSGPLWGRWGKAKSELWLQIFQEDLGDFPSDILYAFGLLYALGYRPDLRFRYRSSTVEEETSAAVEGLIAEFDQYTEVDAGERRLIEEYVQEKSTGGIFTQSWTTSQGFMLWRVDQRLDSKRN